MVSKAENRPRLTPHTLGYREIDPGDMERDVFLNYLQGASKAFADDMPEWAGWFLVGVRQFHEHAMADLFRDIGLDPWVPETTEERVVAVNRGGHSRAGRKRKKITQEERVLVYPGFILIRCIPSAQAWHAINAFKGVIGIVVEPMQWQGAVPAELRLASALSDREINRLRRLSVEVQTPATQPVFKAGEDVTIKDGPFATLHGFIADRVHPYGQVWVEAIMFGRATPVLLEFEQVKKRVVHKLKIG